MIRKIKKECDFLPAFYRTAYIDCSSFDAICYPIGIHWIMRIIHRLWLWSHSYTPTKLDIMLEEARQSGREYEHIHSHKIITHRCEQSRREGFTEGFNKGKDIMLKLEVEKLANETPSAKAFELSHSLSSDASGD